MRALTHQIAGAGLAGVSAPAIDARVSTAAVLVGAAWIGSLLPDADLAGARLHRRTRLERRAPLLWLAGLVLRLPVRLLSLLPHRGPTHSALACVLVMVLCAVAMRLLDPALGPAAAAGVAIGYGGPPRRRRVHAVGRAVVGAARGLAPMAAAGTRPDHDRQRSRVPGPRAAQHAAVRRGAAG